MGKTPTTKHDISANMLYNFRLSQTRDVVGVALQFQMVAKGVAIQPTDWHGWVWINEDLAEQLIAGLSKALANSRRLHAEGPDPQAPKKKPPPHAQ